MSLGSQVGTESVMNLKEIRYLRPSALQCHFMKVELSQPIGLSKSGLNYGCYYPGDYGSVGVETPVPVRSPKLSKSPGWSREGILLRE